MHLSLSRCIPASLESKIGETFWRLYIFVFNFGFPFSLKNLETKYATFYENILSTIMCIVEIKIPSGINQNPRNEDYIAF